MDLAELVWKTLKEESRNRSRDITETLLATEKSGEAFQFPSSTLANAPTGMVDSENRFIINGRKPGEGAGTGTGVPAYYNPGTSAWLNFSDHTAVLT